MKSESSVFGRVRNPKNPEQIINGVFLTIKHDGIQIEVPSKWLGNEVEKFDVIHGEFNDLELQCVTLINVRFIGGNYGSGGGISRFSVSTLLTGLKVDSISDLKMRRVEMVSKHLPKWIRVPEGIKYEDQGDTLKLPIKRTLSTTKLSSGLSIDLCFFYSHEPIDGGVSLKEKIVFVLSNEKGISYDELGDIERKLKSWILFFSRQSPDFEHIIITDLATTVPLGKGTDENPPMKLDDCYLITAREEVNAKAILRDFRIDLRDFEKNLGECLFNWFEQKYFEIIIDLILDRDFNSNLSISSNFFNQAVAIESFHSSCFGKMETARLTKLKLLKTIILSKLEEKNNRTLFSESTQNWGSNSFRERLNFFKVTFRSLLLNVAFNEKALIQKTLDARNSLAHSGIYSMPIGEMVVVSRVLKFTLKLEIIKVLINNPTFHDDLLTEATKEISQLAKINGIGKKN
ncbi:MAG: hypothetical protein ACI9YL_001734 [Luteibaculaceae bacterium]|jgi:hypothetical protein